MVLPQPLIAILGTTGVGKSNLGVELALRLIRGVSNHGWKGAKIINADSMQVYTGLDIITNKIPEAEKRGVEHLLMDFKKPGDQYVVGDFVRDALKLVGTDCALGVEGHNFSLDTRNSRKTRNPYCCRWNFILDPAFDVSKSPDGSQCTTIRCEHLK
jgi:hypothetical protein